MKLFKRIAITVCATVFMFALVPASSFAVDPVSASTMANALAQAITAYGASQGVSMTYDVSNTDGIGEGVHDLWEQFKQDVNDNDIPTYDSLAVTVWSTLFTKVNNHVGINLADTTVGYLDAFWNWLLSGPAEMTKVDNAYAWSTDQLGNVTPISVVQANYFSLNGVTLASLPQSYSIERYYNGSYRFNGTLTVSSAVSGGIIFIRNQSDPSAYTRCVVFESNASVPYTVREVRSNGYDSTSSYSAGNYAGNIYAQTGGTIFHSDSNVGNIDKVFDPGNIPVYTGNPSDLSSIFGQVTGSTSMEEDSDSISVQPYVGDATPQDVYIPDNEDVNYAPLPYVGELDIPWDDSLFGDGTGSLTDAQSEAITDDLSSVIEQDSTLTLAEDTPIVNPPSEVYIPLLPVTLPSFNFSFSGIWHYVVTWVGSLGSWLTLMFSVWNSLPYAIVIPVYASAVVVIIIGTLKRFL